MKKIYLLLACMAGVLGMQAETFVQVTDASTLKEGDKVVMGCAAKSEVSAGFSSTNKYLDAVAATFADNKATLDNPTVITLKKNGSYWNLYLGSKVIGHKSGSSDLDGAKCRYTTNFAITIDANGTANIVSQTPGVDNAEVFFNHHNTSSRFSLYKATSNQRPIELYKLDEGSVPEVVVTSVELNKHAAEIRVGNTETLTATVLPADAVDKTIAWGTTNASVATVVNGVVTAKAEGVAKIWVKATAVENVSDTCVVTVLPAPIEGNATYNAVKDAAYLSAGAKVFVGTIKEGENYVMGQYASGNNIKGVAATYGEGRHLVTAPLQVAYTVERDGNKYLFKDHDGKYLICNGDKKLISSSTKDNKAQWTLGAFNEDDGTVTLTNAYYTSYGIFNNWQGSNDMFSAYGGVGDGSNLAYIILYSDQAPEWEDRPKDPWIHVASTSIDWGQVEPVEGYTDYWSEAKTVELTMNDLPADIQVELTNDGNGTFECYGGTISKNKTSEHFTVNWVTEQVGVYEGEITLTCPGLETIKIQLHAEAIARGQGGEEPELTVSVDRIYLNPNYENETSDEITFYFSAKNLAKPLYVKWEKDNTAPWFPYSSEYMQLWRTADNDYVEIPANQKIDYGTDDIENAELYIYVYAYTPGQDYTTQLHFTSYKFDSKTEYAIDKIIPIHIRTSEQPIPEQEGIEDVQGDKVQSTKVLRDGKLYIIRNGECYSVTGVKE